MTPEQVQGETVLVEVAEHVGTITLNVPDRLNALDVAMVEVMTSAVRQWGTDPEVRVILFTGSGRGFCSGAALTPPDPDDDPVKTSETLFAIGSLIRAITQSSTPTVALVNGVAAGVGASIAIACHYVLARESASFMLAFTKIGLMPDGAATALVAASVGRARALRMALTAEKVSAATALEWGLIAETAPDDDFVARGAALVAGLAAGAPLALSATASAINAASLGALDDALAREESGQASLLQTADFAEGSAAFLAKRSATFTGS